MMFEYCGVYNQGALFYREDFDVLKTIRYFCDMYRINLDDEIVHEIKNNDITDEHFAFLCNELEVNTDVKTLQELCSAALNSYEINDLFIDSAKSGIGNDMVFGKLYPDLQGLFMFYDDMPHKTIAGECMMLCFNVPYAWDIKNVIIPVDRRIAVFQLQQATKPLFKDNIDWDKRLGCLYGITKNL